MPDMMGEEVALILKDINADVPIVMLTGFGSSVKTQGENPPGIDFILSKPITVESLVAMANKATTPRGD